MLQDFMLQDCILQDYIAVQFDYTTTGYTSQTICQQILIFDTQYILQKFLAFIAIDKKQVPFKIAK